MQVQEEKLNRVYLGGEWVATDDVMEIVNPATGEAFARVCRVSRDQVRTALETAQAALPKWRSLTAKERGIFLNKVADELHRRQDEVAHTITLENGKPLAQSKGEVAMTEDHLRWFAEEGRRAYGRMIPHQTPGKR